MKYFTLFIVFDLLFYFWLFNESVFISAKTLIVGLAKKKMSGNNR